MTDILFYAEDPGAANFLSGLPAACRDLGLSCILLAEAGAADMFRARGESFEMPGTGAEGILAEFDPKLVVVGTSENRDSLGLALLTDARLKGVPTVGAVDAPMCAEGRFMGRSGDPLGHAPDWILAPDDETRNRFAALGFVAERVMVQGHPMYDHVWRVREKLGSRSREGARRKLFGKLGPQQKVVVFAAEISDGLHPEDFMHGPGYTLSGRGGSDKRTDIVFEEFLDALPTRANRPYVVLRLHPKNRSEEFASYAEEIDLISSVEPVHELVWAADFLVGMTSILLAEGAILGRPTLSIVPRESESRHLVTVRAGLTPCAWHREGVRTEIERLLKEAYRPRQLPAWMRVQDVRQRIAGVLAEIVRQGAS